MKAIGLALLILALPVLSGLAPDPETIQGHIATCPNCVDMESNPARCEAMVTMSLRNYQDELKTTR